ncbi:MAG: Tyrosine--tRNA ligase [Candidatus Omnitrophica bacterium]|nr:Tyrosine--tRNA ligase [Candidatus Omnitrophota bacterium]
MARPEELALLRKNAVELISERELGERLEEARKNGRPLRVKAGFDPSAPDIHLGHTVLLRKLRQFQDLGHKVVFIIGDYTAMIGDPTGKTQTRPALSKEEVAKNAKTYQDQAFRILDPHPSKIEIVRNSDWFFAPDMFRTFLESVGTQYTVARLLERDDFEKRMQADQPISIREFIYPLLQGYDSVVVKADVEIGGNDQKFNLLVGRNLQRSFGQQPQVVMTLPLLVGLDGTQKMSKSLGNYIAVNDSPKDMFGKAMSIPDALMPTYYDLLTAEDGTKVAEDVRQGRLHPKEAKLRLAMRIVADFYGQDQANTQREDFERVFSERQIPETPDDLQVPAASIGAAELVKRSGAVSSSSEAFRLIQQGGVTLNGARLSDPKAQIQPVEGAILKVGKRSFYRLRVR